MREEKVTLDDGKVIIKLTPESEDDWELVRLMKAVDPDIVQLGSELRKRKPRMAAAR